MASERTGVKVQQLRGAGPGAGALLSVTRKGQQVEGGSHWTPELAVSTGPGDPARGEVQPLACSIGHSALPCQSLPEVMPLQGSWVHHSWSFCLDCLR